MATRIEHNMTKQQMTNLIGAGTIAAIMLIIALVFSGGNNANTAGADPGGGITTATEVIVDPALQTENMQLKEAVQVLQEREAQFTEQINLANEQLATSSGYGEGAEGEEYEEEEYEEEEEEYEEED